MEKISLKRGKRFRHGEEEYWDDDPDNHKDIRIYEDNRFSYYGDNNRWEIYEFIEEDVIHKKNKRVFKLISQVSTKDTDYVCMSSEDVIWIRKHTSFLISIPEAINKTVEKTRKKIFSFKTWLWTVFGGIIVAAFSSYFTWLLSCN